MMIYSFITFIDFHRYILGAGIDKIKLDNDDNLYEDYPARIVAWKKCKALKKDKWIINDNNVAS